MNALNFPPADGTRLRIAVIGAGITGLGAAWALSKLHDVTVYEKDARLGGHANTVDIDYDGRTISVDTGFIVYNNVTYPNLIALFEALGVVTEDSDMSFGVSFDGGSLEYAGDNVGTLFAQKRNIFSLRHHVMWTDILRFNRTATADIKAGVIGTQSLADYLKSRRFSDAFRDRYLLPMGAAIWSTPNAEMLNFPAASLLSFFQNHGLLSGFNTFKWRTVTGGSRQYVTKLVAAIQGTIRPGCGAAEIRTVDGGVSVTDTDGGTTIFNDVVMACHAGQALSLLADSTAAERAALTPLRTSRNIAVLHRDPALMPRRKSVWSSWNYLSGNKPGLTGAPVSLTYWMNRLQNIDRAYPLFVTLNPAEAPKPDLTFGTYEYWHPQFDEPADAALRALRPLQGQRHIWFCGAWAGHGFHEDGLGAGLEIAAALGAPAPWGSAGRPRVFAAQSAA